jgi:hypothetical protein
MLDGHTVQIVTIEGFYTHGLSRKGDRLGLLVRPLSRTITQEHAHMRARLAHRVRIDCSDKETMA